MAKAQAWGERKQDGTNDRGMKRINESILGIQDLFGTGVDVNRIKEQKKRRYFFFLKKKTRMAFWCFFWIQSRPGLLRTRYLVFGKCEQRGGMSRSVGGLQPYPVLYVIT